MTASSRTDTISALYSTLRERMAVMALLALVTWASVVPWARALGSVNMGRVEM